MNSDTAQLANVESKDPIALLLKSYAQNIMVVVFGLLPLFFIPSDSAPFEYTKILLVAGGTFGALVLYSLSALRAGGVHIGISLPIMAAWGLALIALISAVLSGDVRDALMGDVMTTQTTVFVALLALVMSVWTLIDAGKRAVMRLYILLSFSTIVLVLFHALRIMFGPDTLSFSLFTSATASPVGTWNDLALFFGLSIILSLVALEQLSLTRSGKILFVVVTVLSLGMLAVINFFAVWLVLGFTSLTVLVYALTKDRMSGTQLSLVKERALNSISLTTSLAVFIISVLFIIGGGALGGMISERTGISYVEVRPSLTATLDIARHVYSENTFFGIGPNKFTEAWRFFKDPAINTTVFWNTDFIAGNGYMTSSLVTMGVLGVLGWLAFLIAFLFTGIRMLVQGNDQDKTWYFVGISSFVAGTYIWGMSIVYVPSAVILMLGALCVGVMITADRALRGGSRKEFALVTNKRTGFIFTFAVIAVIVGSVSSIYVLGTHYVAAREYVRGVSLYSEGNRDGAIDSFKSAYTLYQSDVYARRLGELYFERLNTILNLPAQTEAEQAALRTEFQSVAQQAIAAADEARKNDPSEADNWALLGNLYGMLIGLNVDGVYEKASEMLVRAKELNPVNPIPPLNLGILDARVQKYDTARAFISEAIRLRPNFTEAFSYLSQIDVATGNVEGAIDATRSIIGLEPQNPVRYYQLGVLEAARRNLPNAIASFEQAVILDPNYANARYMLGLAYDENGRKDDALAQLKKVEELNPGNEDVKAQMERISRGEKRPAEDTGSADVREVNPVSNSDGTITTEEDPDTNLVSPVNTVPTVPTP